MKNRYVYADNAATTQIPEEVLQSMLPWLRSGFGNPSSIYQKGREALAAIEKAREQVAGGSAQPQVKSSLPEAVARRTTGQSRASPAPLA